MKPSFLHILIRIFIGVPGALLWGGGLFCVIGCIIMTLGTDRYQIQLVDLLGLVGLLCVTMVGFAMVMSTEIVTSGKRYRMEARRLLPCAGLEFSAQILAVGSVALIIVAVMQAGGRKLPAAFFFGITGAVMLAETCLVASRANTMRKRWKAEYRQMREDAPWD